jgi:L-ascorbate metabolism protein UlaG (beta-lactamase superfamily)
MQRVLLLSGVFSMISCSNPTYPISDHFDGKIFHNQNRASDVDRSIYELLKWKLGGKVKEWPDQVVDNVEPELPSSLESGEAAVTFVNHATDLIQLKNLNVITDPVFSERVSPLKWAGPKRHRQPGVSLEALPPIQIIVVSHNHYDHMDLDSLAKITKRDHAKVLVPLGNKKFLKAQGIEDVEELDWWQSLTLADGSKITLVPMQHWSSRGLFDQSETLWGGFVIEASGLKILFAGDTGYGQQFREIREKFGPLDISILPIGAYEPRWFMEPQHMNPKDAVQAHIDLGSALSIGTHFGTFQLTDEGIEDPVVDLQKSLLELGVDPQKFLAPKHGQTIRFGSR